MPGLESPAAVYGVGYARSDTGRALVGKADTVALGRRQLRSTQQVLSQATAWCADCGKRFAERIHRVGGLCQPSCEAHGKGRSPRSIR